MGQPRGPSDRVGRAAIGVPEQSDGLLYIWLDGEPGIAPANATCLDVPGERDLDLIAAAVVAGELGRILPARLRYADRPDPTPAQARSIDTARFLRDYRIRHRRRYEVLLDAMPERSEGR